MSEKPNTFLSAVLVAIIVLAGLAPAGYYGFMLLKEELQASQGQPSAVFVELKNETIAEIRAVKTAAVEEIGKLREEVKAVAGGGVQIEAVNEIKSMVDSLQMAQKSIVERLTKLDEHRTVAANAPAPMAAPAMPPAISANAHTIYFARGVAKGPTIDAQVKDVLANLKTEKGKEPCRITVSGFSDTLGNDVANLKLSQMRADYVAEKIKTAGYMIESVRGWGERWLKVHTVDGTENELNRRVVIEMTCGTPLA